MSYERIRKLDPLQLDDAMIELPKINAEADTASLAGVVDSIVTHEDEIQYWDEDTSMAALRDIDFFLASGVRHGENFIETNPALERILLQLGKIANTVPRGSVATYALANPNGERQRSFTGSDTEALFIESVKESSEEVEHALMSLAYEGIDVGLVKVDHSLQAMIDAIIAVKRGVTPKYFTSELRPYFDSVKIGGTEYAGAGGAQLQLVAVDYLLWGMDASDPTYTDYFNDNYRYLSPVQKNMLDLCVAQLDGKSILTVAEENPGTYDAEVLHEIFKKLKKFRYPHRRLAEENFKIRPDGSVGSGTYAPDILDVLIDHTTRSLERTENLINE